jgi:thiamine pyrophosphate-dependent acetolactate synthase large subunit-like protein
MRMRPVKVAEAMGEALVELGVEHVFGLVGSGNFRVTEAMRARGARFLSSRQETSAVTAADGYATVTGRAGVVTVHQGPGYTNAITGMVETAKSRSPVLLIAADTPDAWVHSNFRVDQAAMAEAGGIAVVRPTHAADVATALARAWHLVSNERRATALLLPLDVQEEEAPDGIRQLQVPDAAPSWRPDAGDVERAVALAARADRPVVIAGRGAVLSDAGEPIERFAEAIGAPVATSAVANGLFGDNPWNVGISGGFATPVAAEIIGAADLIVSFGASLTRWTTRHGRLIADDAAIIQVDHDAAAIGVHHPVAVGLVADARLAAEALVAATPRSPAGQRTDALRRRIAAGSWRDQPFEDGSTADTIDPRTLTMALDRLLPEQRTVVVDGGHFSGWPTMYLRVPDAAGFLFHQAFQSIGLGLGTAVGAAAGRPDRLTVAALGDGCTFMALGELETAARLGAPMLVLVYNDDAYGAEVHHFADDDVPLDTVRFPPTDLAAVGRALGCEGVTVRALEDLAAITTWLGTDRAKPLVVDVKVAPDVVGAWLPEAFRA